MAGLNCAYIRGMNSVRVGKIRVTLAPGDDLRAEAQRLEGEAVALRNSGDQLHLEAEARLIEAGMVLVSRAQEWLPANPGAGRRLALARRAVARVDELGAPPGADPKPRFAVFGRRRQQESPASQAERVARGQELRAALTRLGRTHGEALDVVRPTRAQAADMEVRAAADLARAKRLQRSAEALITEAGHRDQAHRDLGFDAPLEAATLQRSGPEAGHSPLLLRGGEALYLVQPAELARDRGFASADPVTTAPPPVAVTGIPFAVGSRVKGAVPRESLSMLGAGEFVVTDQRLGFVGKLKSFSFPVADLLRVHRYDDGLWLLREGRDNPDVVITAAAGRILFYINWVLLTVPGKAP